MNRLFAIASFVFLSNSALATPKVSKRKPAQEDAARITCTKATEEITTNDTVAMIRGNSDFNQGQLKIDLENWKDVRMATMLQHYNEEKDEVSYKHTLTGKASNLTSGATRNFINACEVTYVASSCHVKSTLCSGNSFPK